MPFFYFFRFAVFFPISLILPFFFLPFFCYNSQISRFLRFPFFLSLPFFSIRYFIQTSNFNPAYLFFPGNIDIAFRNLKINVEWGVGVGVGWGGDVTSYIMSKCKEPWAVLGWQKKRNFETLGNKALFKHIRSKL